MTTRNLSLAYSRERDDQERRLFHSIFGNWLLSASDEDLDRLEEARECYALHQVCSTVSLVRGCLQRPDLTPSLPQSLRQLLQERRWPQAASGAPAP